MTVLMLFGTTRGYFEITRASENGIFETLLYPPTFSELKAWIFYSSKAEIFEDNTDIVSKSVFRQLSSKLLSLRCVENHRKQKYTLIFLLSCQAWEISPLASWRGERDETSGDLRLAWQVPGCGDIIHLMTALSENICFVSRERETSRFEGNKTCFPREQSLSVLLYSINKINHNY